jgi:hypothetical protein
VIVLLAAGGVDGLLVEQRRVGGGRRRPSSNRPNFCAATGQNNDEEERPPAGLNEFRSFYSWATLTMRFVRNAAPNSGLKTVLPGALAIFIVTDVANRSSSPSMKWTNCSAKSMT